MKRFACLFVSLATTLFASVAGAQTPPNVPGTLNVSWTLPTDACTNPPTCTVNVPLTGAYALTGIQLYVSTAPIPDNYTGAPSATFGGGITTATYNTTVPNGSTVYVRVRAVNQFNASPYSTEVSKVINIPAAPRAPSGVTITLTITP